MDDAPDLDSQRELDRHLSTLAEAGELAPFVRKLSRTLARIRREFQGAARVRLEAVVAETLERQLRLEHNRRRADAALRGLQDQQEELIQALHGVLLKLAPDENATRH